MMQLNYNYITHNYQSTFFLLFILLKLTVTHYYLVIHSILNVSFLLISKSYSYVLKNSILMAKILDSVELAHEELTHD